LSTSSSIYTLTFINIYKNLKYSRLITLNQYFFKKHKNKPSARPSSPALKESPQKKYQQYQQGRLGIGSWLLAVSRWLLGFGSWFLAIGR
jgi:hypothetical protein